MHADYDKTPKSNIHESTIYPQPAVIVTHKINDPTETVFPVQ